MSPGLAVFLMMNNYFHDVATAMVLAAGITMRFFLVEYDSDKSAETARSLLRLYGGISAIVRISWVWIAVGGVLRLITFRDFEWANAVGKHQEYSLIVKYGIALSVMAGGAYLWARIRKRMEMIKNPSPDADRRARGEEA